MTQVVEAVRRAVPGDGRRCAELCAMAVDDLQGVRGGSLYLRREAVVTVKALLRPGGIDRLLADRRRQVLVGTLDDAVVGLAVGRIDQVGDATIGIVDACYVEPEARELGVGRALLDSSVEWLQRSGCRGVDASALPGDRLTKGFFEAAGFKARMITMHQGLE